FGNQKNPFNVASQNGKGARRQGSAEAVGNGVAGILGLQRSGSQGPVSVVGAGRLAADDSNVSSNAFGGKASTAEQASAAYGRKDSVEIWRFFQEFLGCRSLPGDDAVIVVRMDKVTASFCLYTV